MDVKSRIKDKIEVEWKKLKNLQPDNAKININKDALKRSIAKNGFSMPFMIWKDGKDVYTIDGHTRVKALKEMEADGFNIPQKLTALEIDAKDRKEAISILIEVFNQKQNKFDSEVLVEWMTEEEITEVDIETVNVEDSVNKANDGELPEDMSDELEFSFKLEVDCESEEEQEKLYNELTNKGYQCKILIL